MKNKKQLLYISKEKIRHLVFVLILVLVNTSIYGQNTAFVNLTIGPSIMSQSIGKDATGPQSFYTSDPSPFYLKPGYQLNLDFGYFLNPHLGLTGRLGYSQYPFDSNSVSSQSGYPNYPVYNSVKTTYQSYRKRLIMAGPFIDFKKAKTDINLKFMIGAYRAYYPTINFKDNYTDYNNLAYYGDETQTGTTSTEVALMFSGGIRYKLVKKIYFIYNMDFLYTTEAYNLNTKVTTTQNGTHATNQSSSIPTFATVTAFSNSIGIGFTIGWKKHDDKKE